MRLEEAIRRGTNYMKCIDEDGPVEFDEALLLLIEAGETVLEMRHYPFPDGIVCLPGETEK